MRVTVRDLQDMQRRGERIAMITAYDYCSARIVETAGIPIILVGDSLGQVILGYDSTVSVTMDEMVHHTKAVVRGTDRTHIVGDMPFLSHQAGEGQRTGQAADDLGQRQEQHVARRNVGDLMGEDATEFPLVQPLQQPRRNSNPGVPCRPGRQRGNAHAAHLPQAGRGREAGARRNSSYLPVQLRVAPRIQRRPPKEPHDGCRAGAGEEHNPTDHQSKGEEDPDVACQHLCAHHQHQRHGAQQNGGLGAVAEAAGAIAGLGHAFNVGSGRPLRQWPPRGAGRGMLDPLCPRSP